LKIAEEEFSQFLAAGDPYIVEESIRSCCAVLFRVVGGGGRSVLREKGAKRHRIEIRGLVEPTFKRNKGIFSFFVNTYFSPIVYALYQLAGYFS